MKCRLNVTYDILHVNSKMICSDIELFNISFIYCVVSHREALFVN